MPVANSLLHSRPHICYKQFTESSSVASRSYCLQLSGVVRHLSLKRACSKALNRPGHGTSFGKHHVSEGYLQSKDLQKDLFSISCLPYRRAPKVAFRSTGRRILLRAFERPL